MLAAPIHDRWLLRGGAIVVVVLLVTASILSTFAVSGEAATSVIALMCLLIAPPMFVVAIVLSGRLMLDFGIGEQPKGELEQLLETKRVGALRLDARHFSQPSSHHVRAKLTDKKQVPSELAHYVQAKIATPTVTVQDVADVLDQLVVWKRQQCAGIERDA